MMKLEEFVKQLGEELGNTFTVKDNICTLEIEGLEVSLQEFPDIGALMFLGELGSTPPYENIQHLLSGMLMANYLCQGTSGSVITRDPETGDFILMMLNPIEKLNYERFKTKLECFTNTMECWHKVIEEYRPPENTEVNTLENDRTSLAAFLLHSQGFQA